jgi:hypothetical protein
MSRSGTGPPTATTCYVRRQAADLGRGDSSAVKLSYEWGKSQFVIKRERESPSFPGCPTTISDLERRFLRVHGQLLSANTNRTQFGGPFSAIG